jgi:hypothetical protein
MIPPTTAAPLTTPPPILGPRIGQHLMDPADPRTWTVLGLRYTRHAVERASERGLPMPAALPNGSRLADLDCGNGRIAAAVFKVPGQDPKQPGFFAVVSPDGWVVTLFQKGIEWDAWTSAKRHHRQVASRLDS